MTWLLVLAAVICWAIGAITGFGWFGAHWDINQIVGIVALGLFFHPGLTALVPVVVDRRRPPA